MTVTDFGVFLEGNVKAEALAANTPLSFWGGVDVASGLIQDVHHDLYGQNLSGKMLCIPFDRGSCSGSGVLLEMIRQGTSPAGIVCVEAEAVLALGPIIGEKMYQKSVPIRTISQEIFDTIQSGDTVVFEENRIEIVGPGGTR